MLSVVYILLVWLCTFQGVENDKTQQYLDYIKFAISKRSNLFTSNTCLKAEAQYTLYLSGMWCMTLNLISIVIFRLSAHLSSFFYWFSSLLEEHSHLFSHVFFSVFKVLLCFSAPRKNSIIVLAILCDVFSWKCQQK